MSTTRQAAVAGTFYPADPHELSAAVRRYLGEGARTLAGQGWNPSGRRVKAIVAPHAGYVYSGPIAGTAFAALAGADPRVGSRIRRAVVIGPSHFVAFRGIAVPSAGGFATPVGRVAVDTEAMAGLLELPFVHPFDPAHAREHALEVELPFLLAVAPEDVLIVPLVVGEAAKDEVAEVLARVWGGDETVIVVSSDLSHYHSYQEAEAIDAETAARIVALEPDRLSGDRACGWQAVRGLLELARARGLAAVALDLRNSGDTAGPRDRVVGYGAFAFAPTD